MKLTKENTPTGTIVILKSGSPLMTVDWTLRDDDFVPVTWFDLNEIKRDAFPSECLVIVRLNIEE